MKYLFLVVGLLTACAAFNPYAYSGVMTKAECEAECSSRGYGVLGLTESNGQIGCMCDGVCVRPRRHGGCERLAPAPGLQAPSSQM